MNGPEHYREAESNLDFAARASDRGNADDAMFWHQAAQVHATLALAAATALNPGVAPGDWLAWLDVAGKQTEVIPREPEPQAGPCRHDDAIEPLASMKGSEVAERYLNDRDRDDLERLLLHISGYCPSAFQSALDRYPRGAQP